MSERDRHREAPETIRQKRKRLREAGETARIACEDVRVEAEATLRYVNDDLLLTDAMANLPLSLLDNVADA